MKSVPAGGLKLLDGVPVGSAAVVFAAEGIQAIEIDLDGEAVDGAVGRAGVDAEPAASSTIQGNYRGEKSAKKVAIR